jgi:hypothetical protein
MAYAHRHGVNEHESKARRCVAAVNPRVIGAALDHDVASFHVDRGIVAQAYEGDMKVLKNL